MSTRKITAIGMGIALFVALSLCLQVPVFENYYLCLGYIVMTFYCYSLGPISGTIVGTAGVILYCLLISGLRGMPGWVAGNIFIGIVLGLWFSKSRKKLRRSYILNILSIIIIIVATAIAMLGIKSVVECVLYSQPFLIRVVSNMYAFIADTFVIIFGFSFCKLLDNPSFNVVINRIKM